MKAAWGAPDRAETVNDIERWSYKTDLRWNGVLGVFIVVPVPLIVPTGRNELVVEFLDDRVRAVDARYQVSQNFGCGFVVTIHGGGWHCSNGEAHHDYALYSTFCSDGARLQPASDRN